MVNMMNLKISTLLLLIVLSCLALSATTTTTITAAAPPAAQLCRDTLDPSKINDDYCDCEVDGSDETETSACSHVHILTPNSQAHEQPNRFLCRNQGYISANIHTSKTHDGICDCCDGSDEPAGRCPSRCHELGKDMKLALKSKIDTVKTGLKIKRERSEQAKAEFTVKKRELEQLKSQLEAKNKEKLVATAEKERLEKIEDVEKNLLREKKELERAAKQKKEEDEEEEEKKKEAEENNNEEDENEWTHFKTEVWSNIEYAWHSVWHYYYSCIRSLYGLYSKTEAEKARETVTQLEKDIENLSSQISKIESLFNIDFGADNEYYAIYEKCFTMKQRQYTYEACMYGRANQKEHGSTHLGTYASWNEDKTVMKFQHGTRCWQGPDRSCDVKMQCGIKEEIISVDEPSRCVYTMVMTSPSACTEATLASLEEQLKQLQ